MLFDYVLDINYYNIIIVVDIICNVHEIKYIVYVSVLMKVKSTSCFHVGAFLHVRVWFSLAVGLYYVVHLSCVSRSIVFMKPGNMQAFYNNNFFLIVYLC